MRWHLRLAPVCGALIFFLASFSSALPPDKGETGKDKAKPANFYPIDVGNTWNYRTTANGKDGNVTTKIVKHEKINDVVMARLEIPNGNMTEHLTQTAKGVFRHRHNGIEVTPAFQLLPYPAKAGNKWDGEFTAGADPQKYKYTGEIEKEETVEVPAGKFKTLRVRIKLEGGGQQMDTTYWFAQDVGFVKQTVDLPGVSVLLELEKFERKKAPEKGK